MNNKLSKILGLPIDNEFVQEVITTDEAHKNYLLALSGEFIPPYSQANRNYNPQRLGGIGDLKEDLGGLAINGVMIKGDWQRVSSARDDSATIYRGIHFPYEWAPGSSALLILDSKARPEILSLNYDIKRREGLSFNLSVSQSELSNPVLIVYKDGKENDCFPIGSEIAAKDVHTKIANYALKFYNDLYCRQRNGKIYY